MTTALSAVLRGARRRRPVALAVPWRSVLFVQQYGLSGRISLATVSSELRRQAGDDDINSRLTTTQQDARLPQMVGSTADIAAVPRMKSSELRRLAEAAVVLGGEPELWNAISARCAVSAEQLHYWDIVHILQAFTSAHVSDESLFLHLADVLCSKTAHMAPRHILDLFAVYEAHNLRPRALYVELFYALIRLARSMYAEEVSLSLQALARYRIGNPTVVAHLVQATRRQLGEFRFRYLCGVTGALGALETCHAALISELDSRARLEVETVTVQELLDNLQAFPLLEYSWAPYEKLCKDEFVSRARSFETWKDVDQLADPFQALYFMQARGLLDESFLEAVCQWCLNAVHRPNVRSERRPTARQLTWLYDRCREYNLEDSRALQDAVSFYVESGGGTWQHALPGALSYRRHRHYFRTEDPLETKGWLLEDGISQPAIRRQSVAAVEGLAGLPSLTVDHAPRASLDLMPVSTEVTLVTQQKSAWKPSAGETVRCWTYSRKSVRPRQRELAQDKGRRFMDNPNRTPTAVWARGSWTKQQKYFPGNQPGPTFKQLFKPKRFLRKSGIVTGQG